MFKTALILLLLFSINTYANPCEDHGNLKSLWDSKYKSFVQNKDIVEGSFLVNSYSYKIAKAICLLENTGIPNSKINFFWYFERFVKALNVDLLDTRGSEANSTKGGDINLFINYFGDHSSLEYGRASALIHEARHIEMYLNNKDTSHVECVRGKEKGIKSCDQEFSSQWETAGPVSYEVLFLRNLHDKSTYSLDRGAIKTLVNYILDNHFNYVSPDLYEKAYYKDL